LILASEKAVKDSSDSSRWRVLSRYAAKGVPPQYHGHWPDRGDSGRPALRRPEQQDDIDWFELNEAFAAQSLAVINTLGWMPVQGQPAWAVPLRWATRWVPPAPFAQPLLFMHCSAPAQIRHGHHVHWHGAGRCRHF
jgi:hypothetical protein